MRKLITVLACLFTLSTFAQSNGDPAFFYYVNPGIKDSKTYASLINDGLFATNNVGGFGLIAKSTFLTPAQGNAAYSLLGHTHAAGDVTSGTIATARLGSGTANSTTFLRGDQTWQTISAGSGDVVGPASSIADNIALFDGITGKLIKDAGINLSEVIEEDPGPGVGMIESGAGVSPIILKNLKNGLGTEVTNNTGSVQVDIDFTAADRYYYSDGSALPVEGVITSAGRNLLDDATTADQRTTLGLGTAAVANTGTGASDVPTITDADARYLMSSGVEKASVSSFTSSSGSFVDITGATVTLDASSTYQFVCFYTFTSTTTTSGMNVSVTMTGSPTSRSLYRDQMSNGTGASASARIASDDAGTTMTTTGAPATPICGRVMGTVRTSGSACTIQMRFAAGGTAASMTIVSMSIVATKI